MPLDITDTPRMHIFLMAVLALSAVALIGVGAMLFWRIRCNVQQVRRWPGGSEPEGKQPPQS